MRVNRGREPERRQFGVFAALVLMTTAAAGCGSVRVSNTGRTATEQLLLTESWDKAMLCLDFGPLRGDTAYLDPAGLTGPDAAWITFRLRQAMLRQGVNLQENKETARYLVEVGVGAYGTDEFTWNIGTPAMAVPGVMAGLPAPAPEVSVSRKSRQYGVVKLAMLARDRETGLLVWESPTLMADTMLKNMFIGPIGPFQSGTLSRRRGLENSMKTLPEAQVVDW